MACRLFGAKPLPKPMEHILVEFESEFIQENSFENVVCQNRGQFIQGEMS